MDSKAAVTDASVSVRLFGPPRIERDGESVAVDTRKAIALLAYLAVTGRPHSRDHLAALLWPEADQARARSALRRTLSTLNSALGGRGLLIEREALGLVADAIDVDVLTFRRLASGDAESLRQAAELARGPLLDGFVLRDSAEFDDWQLQASDEVTREVGEVLERLASDALDTDPEAALAYAQAWVALDELHEPAHRALMRAYARKGDRTSALKQYRACVAALERGLGVEPLEETTELYEAVRQGLGRENRDAVVAPSRARAPVERFRASAELPLVGRATELEVVQRAIASSGTDGRLVVIGGEPGIGKTRLADELLASVRGRAGIVARVTCHPEEQVMAFGTIVEIVRALPRARIDAVPHDALVEASRIVPELVPARVGAEPATAPDSPAARRRLVESVGRVITAASSSVTPSVVVIDDAHWIDASSLEILRFVVRRLRGWSLCLVMTWRTEEVPPAHPLRRMLADAERDDLATGVTLQRLTPDDVDELVRLTDVDADIAATLYAETAGVPFFLAEYIKSGERLPSGVRDLLASRVARVSRSASQVLTAAAVIGRAFDPRTVREASGRSDDEVVRALDELVAEGLLADVGDTYDVTHPKLREFVYEDASLGRRRLLHGRIAKALIRSARRRPELHALVAHHFERAGDEDAAAEHFRAAAEHARSVYANAEALTHLQNALALGEPDAELHEAMGDLRTLDGRYGEAIASFEKAAALGADVGTVGRKLGEVHQRLGDWDAAEAHYAEAEQALAPGRQRARVLAERALNAHRAGRFDLARDLASRAADDADDRRSLAQVHNVQGILASHRGDGAAARRHLQASLEFAEATADAGAEAAALNNLALALRMEGATDLALSNAQASLEICTRIGDRHREAAVHSNIADILHDLGRPDDAMDHLKASVAILADVGEPGEAQPEIWKLVEW